MSRISIRPAGRGDVPAIVHLLDIATYGYVSHVFGVLCGPGADLYQVVKERVEDPASALSYEKAQMAEYNGKVAGFVMCETIPDPADLVLADTPDVFRPLLELESMAPGTTLVNFLAAFAEMRGHGIGKRLMTEAEKRRGPNGMSLTIHDLNDGARKLYEGLGFREAGRRAIVKEGWDHPATEWVLMTKS